MVICTGMKDQEGYVVRTQESETGVMERIEFAITRYIMRTNDRKRSLRGWSLGCPLARR